MRSQKYVSGNQPLVMFFFPWKMYFNLYMLYFESTLPCRGLNSYGFSACKEQAMRVISDSKVHKPGKER